MKLFSPLVDAWRVLTPRNSVPPLPSAGAFAAQQGQYLGYARAYQKNEIVFAAVEMLATSAGEPHIVGRRYRRAAPEIRDEWNRLQARGLNIGDVQRRMIRAGFYEDVPRHPMVKLLNNPNPYMSRGQMWGTVVMDRCLAGNAYLVKSRFQGGPIKGSVAELWRLRPDRVKIIPSAGNFIEAYEYNTGTERIRFAPSDVLHFKTRNPINDYYGQPPLMAALNTLDIDEYMRGFLRTFFERGGTGPGSVLTVKQKMSPEDKAAIRDKFKTQFGGHGGFHEMLVLDNAESTYAQMGLNRGLRDALPKELDNVSEARLAMIFGIPGSILGLLIGYESSSYANKRQDWQVFWDLTMTPLLSDLDDVLNLNLRPDFGMIDEVAFDLSDIRALQEDIDKIHERHRKNVGAGLESWEEGREGIGLDPDLRDGTFLIPNNIVPVPLQRMDEMMPMLEQPKEPAMVAEAKCPGCKRWVGRNVNVGAVVYCPNCKEAPILA